MLFEKMTLLNLHWAQRQKQLIYGKSMVLDDTIAKSALIVFLRFLIFQQKIAIILMDFITITFKLSILMALLK